MIPMGARINIVYQVALQAAVHEICMSIRLICFTNKITILHVYTFQLVQNIASVIYFYTF